MDMRDALIEVKEFSNDKKIKPKKYEFETIKPISVKAYNENFINVFEFETKKQSAFYQMITNTFYF